MVGTEEPRPVHDTVAKPSCGEMFYASTTADIPQGFPEIVTFTSAQHSAT
jgi:hypothetical protein